VKHVVSISLGSSRRNHAVEMEFAGEQCRVERIGTDGDMGKMIEMIKELDGKVDCFGLGGMDLYAYAGQKRYMIRDAKKVARAGQDPHGGRFRFKKYPGEGSYPVPGPGDGGF
jgi:hypothetical protein